MVTKMSFEGLIYQGAAGSEATTQITNHRDVNYNFDGDDGDTTVQGDGSSIPIETMRATSRRVEITFNMVNNNSDTSLAALLAAAYARTPIALRLKDHSSGSGFDGDVVLKVTNGRPFKGEQTYDFTAVPTDASGRAPQLYV